MASADDFEIEKSFQKLKRMIPEHLCAGRFHAMIWFGSKYRWDPDNEVRDFVAGTKKIPLLPSKF